MNERPQFLDYCVGVKAKIERTIPDILRYADDLYRRLSSDKGRLGYIRGLFVMSTLTNSRFDKLLTGATVARAIEKGMNEDQLLNLEFSTPDRVNAGALSLIEASQIAKDEKLKGKKLGFLHGHYRMLTPGSLLGIMLAQEQCDVLFLGMERNWRTNRFKGVRSIYPDSIRENIMVLFPGLVDHVVAISRSSYSNEGYRKIISSIRPDVYFGNEDYSQEVREEMRNRADVIGAEYCELPFIPSFTTSEYLEIGGSVDLNFSLLFGD